MSDTKAVSDHSKQQTDIQPTELERMVRQNSLPVGISTPVLEAIPALVEASTAATIVPTDISISVLESSAHSVEIFPTTTTDQSLITGLNVSPKATTAIVVATQGASVEHQTSVSATDTSAMSSGTNSGIGATGSGNGFRSTFNSGRVSFSRFISVDRTRLAHDASPGRGSNFSNDIFNDFLSLMQQARHPSSLFSSERRSLFTHSSRSNGITSSNLPLTGINGSISNTSSSDVVIDVDGSNTITTGGDSLRSSHNELYQMSNSSSSTSPSIRPLMRMHAADDNAQASSSTTGGGRSSMMPNFNINHHHHHFHNHQPLLMQQHHLPSTTSGGGSSAGVISIATQPSLVSSANGVVDSGIPSGSGETMVNGVPTPTGSVPLIAGTTRSNSVISNHMNDEATVHEALNQIPEARAMIDAFARYVPLLFILFAKLCYDYLDGIILFLLLLMTFYHANWVVRQEITKQKQRRTVVLMRELTIIIVALLVTGFFGHVIEWKSICLVILFTPDHVQTESLKSLLFFVCITDLILKLITIVIKIMVTLMPPRIVDYKSRGKVYLMIESLSQLYRAAAPTQLWLIFLFESYSGSARMVSVIFSAIYIGAKSKDLLDRIKFCRRSLIKLLQKTSYGIVPTKEQLQACGGQCSICHDNFNSPVLLECSHIFCELCVGTWFDREQTCPLCRAKIVDDPSYRDGATTFFLQLC